MNLKDLQKINPKAQYILLANNCPPDSIDDSFPCQKAIEYINKSLIKVNKDKIRALADGFDIIRYLNTMAKTSENTWIELTTDDWNSAKIKYPQLAGDFKQPVSTNPAPRPCKCNKK